MYGLFVVRIVHFLITVRVTFDLVLKFYGEMKIYDVR